MSLPSFAIVGAGLAGLTCAHTLKEAGISSLLFDKARGPGGRLASRRRLDTTLDLGCQALSARQPEFRQQLEDWEHQGLVQPWQEQADHWCALPRMSALTRSLAEKQELMTSTRIQRLMRQEDGSWMLDDERGQLWGPFKGVILATPASQAAPLLQPLSTSLYASVQAVEEQPLWVGYFIAPPGLQPGKSLLQPASPELRRITCLNGKPGQASDLQRWVVEASPEWSRVHLEATAAEVASALFELFKQEAGSSACSRLLLLEAHRWLYGQAVNPLGVGYLSDPALRLYVIGDYCQGSDAEAAWNSGRLLGKALRKTIQ